jgi:hypothetical protein
MKKNTVTSVTLGLFFLIVVAAIFISPLDGTGSHQRAKESVAVGKLHRVTDLQKQYASANPTKGFSCRLSELKPINQSMDQFLVSDSYAGYVFELSECEPGANGRVSRYRITAVPIHRTSQDSKLRAFCTDQDGQIWYDPSGSPETCFGSRRPI